MIRCDSCGRQPYQDELWKVEENGVIFRICINCVRKYKIDGKGKRRYLAIATDAAGVNTKTTWP